VVQTKRIVKLTRNGNSLTVAIPRLLTLDLHLRQYDSMHILRVGNSILVTPVDDIVQGRVNEDAGAAAAVLATEQHR